MVAAGAEAVFGWCVCLTLPFACSLGSFLPRVGCQRLFSWSTGQWDSDTESENFSQGPEKI